MKQNTFLNSMHKKDDVLTFLILVPILDHIFGPKKDKLFSHLWSSAISAECRLKHFMNISWYNSIPVLKNCIRNTVFYSFTNRKPVCLSKVRWIELFCDIIIDKIILWGHLMAITTLSCFLWKLFSFFWSLQDSPQVWQL